MARADKLTIVARLTAKEGKEAALKDALLSLVPES